MNKKQLPSRPHLYQYKKLAKLAVKTWQTEPNSRLQIAQSHPRLTKLKLEELATAKFVLADAQFVIALEHGFDSWPKFAKHVEDLELANDPVSQFLIAACCPIAHTHVEATLDEAIQILANNPEVASHDIYTCAVLGDAEGVKRFLLKNPKLAKRKGGPLHWDVLTTVCFSRYLRLEPDRSAGFAQAARMILEAGASVKTGWYDLTQSPKPEFESVMYGAAGLARNADVTKVLLDFGADPNDNETPYHSPEGYDNSAMVALLESKTLNENSLAMMLLRKADWHDVAGIKLMLEHGANPNFMLMYDSNALQHALLRDNVIDSIRLMLDHGADPLVPNSKGRTGLMIAAKRGRKDLIDLFREQGIDTEMTGVNRLILACAIDDQSRIAHATPKEIQELNFQGASLLAEFAGNENVAGLANLLALGIQVDSLYSGDGYFGISPASTALHVASWKGRHKAVKFLLERGAKPNAVNLYGQTPLILAVNACVKSYWMNRRGPESIQALLAAGASLKGVTIPTGYDDADELLRSHQEHA